MKDPRPMQANNPRPTGAPDKNVRQDLGFKPGEGPATIERAARAAAEGLQNVRHAHAANTAQSDADRFARQDPRPEITHAPQPAPEDRLKVIADHILSVSARMVGPGRDRMLRLLFIEGLETVSETVIAGTVFDGHAGLGRAERETMELVAQGMTSREIARRRDVSLHTVRAQIASCLAKLGAKTRAQATYIAQRRGMGAS